MWGDGKREFTVNFNELYHLRGENKPFLMEWAKHKGSDYTSYDMQKEMLNVMALKKFREIVGEISGAEFYAIMADETSDIANTEQLVISLRWVDDDLNFQEKFILSLLEMTSAETIKVIKDILLHMNNSLSKCCSQCYDGCSTMKCQKVEVGNQIKDIEEKALFPHCFTYALNLAVGDAIKNSKFMKEAF